MLTLLANSPQGMRMFEIVQAIGVSRTTVHRMLRAMVQRGFVESVGRPSMYSLSPYLDGLRARQAAWSRRFLTPSIGYVVRLAKMTQAHVFAGQYVGGVVMARFRCDAGNPDETRIVYGWKLLAYSSALIYQAYMNDDQLNEYRAQHSLSQEDADYWGSITAVDSVLRAAKTEGVLAFVRSDTFRAGAVVLDEDGGICGILAMARDMYTPAGPRPSECVRMLRDAAVELSAEIAADNQKQAAPKPVNPATALGRPVSRNR